MPTGTYPQFRESYRQGLTRIRVDLEASHPTAPGAGDRDPVIVASALSALRSTGFGAVLLGERALRNVLETLEASLEGWFGIACSADLTGTEDGGDLDVWVNSPYMRAYREYLYWGRLGAILHYYRDEGRGLGTDDERDARQAVKDHARDLDERLSDLVDAPIPQALYRTDVLQRVDRLRTLLQRVQRDLSRSPIRAGEGPSPLHRDENLLRRQFCHVCSLLALELFGQIKPHTLNDFLKLKETTARSLGLTRWSGALSEESASRELRRSIEKAAKTALTTSKSRKWMTRPLVQHFSTHTFDAAGELIPRQR